MKNTRKLIPALVMLLISAVLMSTASFAWFSMNKQVTADGMSVTATTPASLEISTAATGSDWSYGATASNSTTGLTPITRLNNVWYVPTATNAIKADGTPTYSLADNYSNTTHWTPVTIDYTTGKSGDVKYALVQDFYLRTNVGTVTTDAPAAIKFTAAATVSGDSDLEAGVQVYLKVGETLTLLSSTASGEWTAPLSSASTPDTPYIQVTVVVVYDGQNAAIINDNADLEETSISLTFAEKVTPPVDPGA